MLLTAGETLTMPANRFPGAVASTDGIMTAVRIADGTVFIAAVT
jgi:hypothetical protein